MLMCADAPLMAFRYDVVKNLVFHKRPALVTHTNDISIHFQTSKDRGVIFATSSVANNDYMKAYIQDGDVHVDTYIERAGGQVRYRLMYSGLREKTRKPYCRKETARCRGCSFRFIVR